MRPSFVWWLCKMTGREKKNEVTKTRLICKISSRIYSRYEFSEFSIVGWMCLWFGVDLKQSHSHQELCFHGRLLPKQSVVSIYCSPWSIQDVSSVLSILILKAHEFIIESPFLWPVIRWNYVDYATAYLIISLSITYNMFEWCVVS